MFHEITSACMGVRHTIFFPVHTLFSMRYFNTSPRVSLHFEDEKKKTTQRTPNTIFLLAISDRDNCFRCMVRFDAKRWWVCQWMCVHSDSVWFIRVSVCVFWSFEYNQCLLFEKTTYNEQRTKSERRNKQNENREEKAFCTAFALTHTHAHTCR